MGRVPGSKINWRKPKYLKGGTFGGRPWEEPHKEARKASSRRVRSSGRVYVMAVPPRNISGRDRVDAEGKVYVASNKCGGDCGRRAAIGDYLCARCRG